MPDTPKEHIFNRDPERKLRRGQNFGLCLCQIWRHEFRLACCCHFGCQSNGFSYNATPVTCGETQMSAFEPTATRRELAVRNRLTPAEAALTIPSKAPSPGPRSLTPGPGDRSICSLELSSINSDHRSVVLQSSKENLPTSGLSPIAVSSDTDAPKQSATIHRTSTDGTTHRLRIARASVVTWLLAVPIRCRQRIDHRIRRCAKKKTMDQLVPERVAPYCRGQAALAAQQQQQQLTASHTCGCTSVCCPPPRRRQDVASAERRQGSRPCPRSPATSAAGPFPTSWRMPPPPLQPYHRSLVQH